MKNVFKVVHKTFPTKIRNLLSILKSYHNKKNI